MHGLCFHFNTIRKSYGLMLQNLLIENDFISLTTDEFVTFVITTKFCPPLCCARESILFYSRLTLIFLDKKEGKLILII